MASKKRSRKSPGSGGKVEKVMHEFKHHQLRSSSGAKVKSRKQAIAIGLSEAREAGENVGPEKPGRGSKKKAAKRPAKKAAKKTAKKTSARKKTTKKSSR